MHRIAVAVFLFGGALGAQDKDEGNSSSSLTPFEKAELRRLLDLDLRDLSNTPIRGVLGFEQEYWRNPASVHVIRPDDVSLNGHVLMVDSFRNVAGMYVTRGVGYDDFVTMTFMPAALPAARPMDESSITTHLAGSNFIFSAASR